MVGLRLICRHVRYCGDDVEDNIKGESLSWLITLHDYVASTRVYFTNGERESRSLHVDM